MRKNNIFLSVVLVSVNVFTAPAADNTLTLMQCLELAKEHNKSIVAAKYQAVATFARATFHLPEGVKVIYPKIYNSQPREYGAAEYCQPFPNRLSS